MDPGGEHEVDAAPLQFGEQRVADVADGPEVDQHGPGGIELVEAGAELVEQRSGELAADRPLVVGLGKQVRRAQQRDRRPEPSTAADRQHDDVGRVGAGGLPQHRRYGARRTLPAIAVPMNTAIGQLQ